MLLLALCGCRAVPTGVDSDRQRVHTNVVESIVRDSVFLRDSIFLHVKADTVYLTKYRTLYKERVVRDTVVMCDTLYRERVVTVEKRVWPPFRWWMLLPVVAFVLWLFNKVKVER